MRYHFQLLFAFLLFLFSISLDAQAPKRYTSAEIHEKIKKLNFLGSVLYLAAHPDDENTTLISYMSNGKKAETAYLSLTRGDGGQNLIGTELKELLGLLRTQELLAARRIDGGKQYFTRANDFGFSKHPDETFEIWNKEEVMSDVVRTIRKFKPDIIINRFDHRSPGTTHGHHTGSAILSVEAFDLTNNPEIYPDQVDKYGAFQPERLFLNQSWWFYRGKEGKWEEAKKGLYTEDVGVYFPLKGKSNTEIAAESRSQHKCQGMGRLTTRGESTEYLELLKGSKPSKQNDIFSGINTSWSRLKGGEKVGELVGLLDRTFDHSSPHMSLDVLIMILQEIESLEDSVWKQRKIEECKEIILACAGVYIDLYTDQNTAVPGDSLNMTLEVINRSPAIMYIENIKTNIGSLDESINLSLKNNIDHKLERSIAIPKNTEFSSPYWLKKKGTLGMYHVENKGLIGQAESPDPIVMDVDLLINNQKIRIQQPLVYKYSDPVDAEVHQPFEVLAPVFVQANEETVIFTPGQKRKMRIEVMAAKDNVSGTITPCFGESWSISPEKINFELDSKNEKAFYEIEITAPEKQDVSKISFIANVDGKDYTSKLVNIEYDHIPNQLVMQSNEVNAISIDITYVGNKVAYIMGAGDKVPDALRAIGYKVDELSEDEIQPQKLNQYPSVIIGIRAYNTISNMKFYHKTLMEYVKNGGTVVVQYNTSHRLKSEEVGPYPISLSRKRVTDEFAPVKIINPDHPVVNYPNKITEKDFQGWIQERGLYFPDEWDSKYTPILSSHDPGEEELEGGLLVAEYGQGHFIYTGYSFFRELPAGVPGAFRLFANLISFGQQNRP